jgi:hypothetical protein
MCGVGRTFCGFPLNQAGYKMWVPSSGEFFISKDVAFNEDFSSPFV